MKNLLRILFALLCASLSFGQGVIVAPQTAFKVVNGLTSPIANATITVCAGNAAGIPCSPALVASIFRDAALTIPLSNPFFSDSTGNYQFAIAPGNYTVTVTNSGFNGQSYQMTVATPISLASGLADPGANGVVYRNGLNTTRVAASADLIALWSGSCNVGTVLRGDGSCAAISPAFSSLTSGTNTQAAMITGNGASLNPVNLGQVAGNQAWLQPGISAPTQGQFSAVNSGGTIGAGHVIVTQYTFNSTLGETLPSILFTPNLGTAGCTIGNCTLTMSAPTIPSGYTGWTMYFCDQSGGSGCTNPVRVNACQNIVTSCSITAANLNSGVATPTVNTSIIAPPNVQATNAPAGFLPSVFFPKTDGNYYPWLGVEWNSCDASGGPPLPCGTPMFTHRTYFNDNPANTPFGGKNTFVGIDHLAGIGTVATNQDRALWVNQQNPASDAATRYSLEAIQAELDFNCNGCTINGSPDGEVTAGSFQLGLGGAATAWTTTGYSTNAVQGRVFRNGAGFDTTGISAVYGNVANNNATAAAGSTLAALRAVFDGTVNAANIRGIGLRMTGPATTSRFGTANGIFSSASFTPSNASVFGGNADAFIDQRTHNWHSYLNGGVGLTSIENTDGGTQALPVNASVAITGSATVSQIISGGTAISSATCAGGASSYTYQLVFNDNNGGATTSASQNTASSCTNPLAGGTPATISFTPAATLAAFRQSKTVDIYRVGGPMGTGKIGTLTCNNDLPINGCNAFSDTGIAAGAALPTGNTTGGTTIGGDLTLGTSKGQHVNTQAANNDYVGTCTLASATPSTCTVTFTRAYTAAPVCVATNQTTQANPIKSAPTTTNVVFTGPNTVTDVVAYICMGNPN